MEKIETKQINVVLVYKENILPYVQIKISDIQRKIAEIWDKQQPVITQFPDIIAVIEPSQQLNCVFQGGKITVSNQDIKAFLERDLDNFLLFITKLDKTLNRPLEAFGFNYSFLFKFSEEEKEKIVKNNKELINIAKLKLDTEQSLLGAGINISYIDNDTNKIQIISTPIYNESLKEMIGLNIQSNVHFYKNNLFEFSDLYRIFKEQHESIVEKINNIFNIK